MASSAPLELSLSVAVHPIVLLSVVDHYTRIYHDLMSRDSGRRVMGVVLGRVSSNEIVCSTSFAVPFEEDPQDASVWYVDMAYVDRMVALHLKVNRAERVVGWYATGSKMRPHDVDLHRLFYKYTPHPVYLMVNLADEDSTSLPVSSCIGVERSDGTTPVPRLSLQHVTCHVASTEAEEICVEHLLRDVSDTEGQGPLATAVSRRLQSLGELSARLQMVASYMQDVAAGALPPNPVIGESVQRLLSLVPSLRAGATHPHMAEQVNDSLAAVTVAMTGKVINQIHSRMQNKLHLHELALKSFSADAKERMSAGQIKAASLLWAIADGLEEPHAVDSSEEPLTRTLSAVSAMSDVGERRLYPSAWVPVVPSSVLAEPAMQNRRAAKKPGHAEAERDASVDAEAAAKTEKDLRSGVMLLSRRLHSLGLRLKPLKGLSNAANTPEAQEFLAKATKQSQRSGVASRRAPAAAAEEVPAPGAEKEYKDPGSPVDESAPADLVEELLHPQAAGFRDLFSVLSHQTQGLETNALEISKKVQQQLVSHRDLYIMKLFAPAVKAYKEALHKELAAKAARGEKVTDMSRSASVSTKERAQEAYTRYLGDVARMRAMMEAEKAESKQKDLADNTALVSDDAHRVKVWRGDDIALAAFADYYETFIHVFRSDAPERPERILTRVDSADGGAAGDSALRGLGDSSAALEELVEEEEAKRKQKKKTGRPTVGTPWWCSYRPATTMTGTLGLSPLALEEPAKDGTATERTVELPTAPPSTVPQILLAFVPPDNWFSVVPMPTPAKKKDE